MCEQCNQDRDWDGEFAKGLKFAGPSMDYHDGPISGWLVCERCGQSYAFYCEAIVFDFLWHWTLQPVDSPSDEDPMSSIRNATGWWFSAMEDRRAAKTHCSGRRLERPAARPPIPVPVRPARGP